MKYAYGMNTTIAKRKFGSTGHESSRVIFGAAALGNASIADVDRAFETLIQYGVNHIDTSVSYGKSEKLIGQWLKSNGHSFFMATKIDARTYEDAHKELHRSLQDLGLTRLDLLQMHELVEDADTDTFLGSQGALRVLIEAKEQGLARFVGVTSHGFNAPRIIKRCLNEYPFDTVLLPFNYALSVHPEYGPAFFDLVSLCRQRGVAVQTMKSIARSPWGSIQKNHTTWYRPLEAEADIERAVHWVMGHGDLFLASVGDVNLLPLFLRAAANYTKKPEKAEMEGMVARLGITNPAQNQWPRLW